MNIALIKLGSRISINSVGTSGGTGETLSIIKMLTTAGANVDAYTKVLSRDEKPVDFNILDIESNYLDINNKNYDCLLVLNGNVTYFGGKDNRSQTLNYYIINNFKGKVFYIMCDCNLFLKQIWPSIINKSWASLYSRQDIEIVRDDIIYITQACDVSKVTQKAQRYVNIKKSIYFPFEKFPLLTLRDMPINEFPEYDILYGGTFRSGRREADMIKFYFGYDPDLYKVEMFGNINFNDFNKSKVDGLTSPIFSGPVNYDKFPEKMHESMATVIIGDKIYKELDDLAQRIYESIRIGNVVLIDSSYDYNKRVFKNSELLEFNYVTTREDVENRLDRLRNDSKLREHLIELQRLDTEINEKDYCITLINILKENLYE